jgi:hypothetical protein
MLPAISVACVGLVAGGAAKQMNLLSATLIGAIRINVGGA